MSLALVVLASAAPVRAQSRTQPRTPARAHTAASWFSVSAGVQPTGKSFHDAFDVPLYTEQEQVTVATPAKTGLVIAASGGRRVWKQLAIGLGITRYSRSGSATITARLPHPFFDNAFRDVEGTAGTSRSETGAHLLFGWMLPISPRVRLLITAGPSVLNARQTLVTGVTFSETYPYDTAAFTGATTRDASRTAAGFNAGADLFWMVPPHAGRGKTRQIGAGVLAQVTRARIHADAGGGRTASFDAGGAQLAGGLRFIF